MDTPPHIPPGWAAQWYVGSLSSCLHADESGRDHYRDSTHQRHLFIGALVYSLEFQKAELRTHTESATGRSQWEHPAESQLPPAAPIDAQPAIASITTGHSKRRQYASGQTQAYYGTSEPPAYGDPSYGTGQPPVQQGGQLFTPGLVAEQGGFQAQQQQTYFVPPEASYQNGQYLQQQPLAQGPPAQQPMGQLTNQFAQMGVQSGAGGQKPVSMF